MKKQLLTLFAIVLILPVLAQPGTKYDISGKWYAYNANGDREWKLDFTIFYNEDTEAYYAKYKERLVEVSTDGVLHFDEEHSVGMEATTKLSLESDSSFTFDKYWQYVVKDARNKRWQYQTLLSYFSCSFSLRYIPGKNKLVGRVQFDRFFEAMGNSDYKTVQDAVRNGKGNVLQDCDGNCGGMDVVYRRN